MTILEPFSALQRKPKMSDFEMWKYSGFAHLMTASAAIVEPAMNLTLSYVPMKYPTYKDDQFSDQISAFLPFFYLIIYCPTLFLLTYKLIREKVRFMTLIFYSK
jgi:hypothetical protein